VKNYLRKNKKYLFLVVDMIIIVLSYVFSLLFRYDVNTLYSVSHNIRTSIYIALATYLGLFVAVGIYNCFWIYSSFGDHLKIISACSLGIAITLLISIIFPQYTISTRCVLLSGFFILFGTEGLRVFIGIISRTAINHNKSNRKNIIIVGAGSAAGIVLNDLKVNSKLKYNVVGLIDDDPFKQNRIIHGYKVIGTRNDIISICEEKRVDEILIAIPSANEVDRQKIISICSETDCKIKIIPSIDQLINNVGGLDCKVRDVQVEDLLSRDAVVLDTHGIKNVISGKTILVTGGGGSIGSELCRQILKFNPKTLIILDIYENNAYDLQNELIRKYPNKDVIVLIASVRDYERLEEIFDKYKPHIVYHAAAHKHVPLMEYSPAEAIKNNVFGTYNVALCADKYKVEKFVMISTDKAVNPTNVMGATKRLCEMIVQSMQEVSSTEFVAVRFGNVLGSNGSVIPLFQKQISEGGPVTVTHKDITRFFMTIPEAAQLVIQASCFAKGGEIFILDMGEPVKIYDLAVNLINLSGHKPNEDIKIEITGLRPGEKLYEELLMEEEELTKTSHSKIYVGKSLYSDYATLKKNLADLKMVLKTNNDEYIKTALSKIVPTYTISTFENELTSAQ